MISVLLCFSVVYSQFGQRQGSFTQLREFQRTDTRSVFVAGQWSIHATGGPEALLQLFCAFQSWLPSKSCLVGSKSINDRYMAEAEYSPCLHAAIWKQEDDMQAGDVYIVPEVEPCPKHLVERGVRVYIWLLAYSGVDEACESHGQRGGCRYLAHNFALSRPCQPPHNVGGAGLDRAHVLRPYITPALKRAASYSHGQGKEERILLDDDNPGHVIAAVNEACAELECHVTYVHGFKRSDLPALYAKSKVVVDWCMVGSERMPIESTLYGTVLLTSACKSGDDTRDFPIPRRNVLNNTNQLKSALMRILVNYNSESADMEPVRALYRHLSSKTLAQETRAFIDSLV